MLERCVGLDTQCLSYLIDAVSSSDEPTDELAEERKALVRIWFYSPGTFYLTPTVVIECAKIQNIERRELHSGFISPLFLDPPIQDPTTVDERTQELLKLHAKKNDCRVLAEAEDLSLEFLLTYDRQFLRRCSSKSPRVSLATPTVYWSRLAVQRGARPDKGPHETNPLSRATWWRW